MAYEEAKRPVPSTDNRAEAAGSQTTQNLDKPGQGKTAITFPLLDALGEIVARPLFNDTRRPITVENPVVAVTPTDLNVMLSGIVIGETKQIAHLKSLTDKQTLALSVGEKIGDWKIQSIFPDHVVLESGGRVETLFMQKPGLGRVAPDPPKAAVGSRTSRPAKTRATRRARRNRQPFKRGGK